MTDERQEARRREIEAAAFEVVSEVGYRRASMLQIAKRAQASNQTLYAWYGNKAGLFRAIIEANGRAVRDLLQEALAADRDPLATLEALGPALLRFTADAKAIAINRAAIADAAETGVLAHAIEEVARGTVFPLVSALMHRLGASGHVRLDAGPGDAAEAYVSLLFGEIRLRQAFGALGPLCEVEIARRAARAKTLILRLYRLT